MNKMKNKKQNFRQLLASLLCVTAILPAVLQERAAATCSEQPDSQSEYGEETEGEILTRDFINGPGGENN